MKTRENGDCEQYLTTRVRSEVWIGVGLPVASQVRGRGKPHFRGPHSSAPICAVRKASTRSNVQGRGRESATAHRCESGGTCGAKCDGTETGVCMCHAEGFPPALWEGNSGVSFCLHVVAIVSVSSVDPPSCIIGITVSRAILRRLVLGRGDRDPKAGYRTSRFTRAPHPSSVEVWTREAPGGETAVHSAHPTPPSGPGHGPAAAGAPAHRPQTAPPRRRAREDIIFHFLLQKHGLPATRHVFCPRFGGEIAAISPQLYGKKLKAK